MWFWSVSWSTNCPVYFSLFLVDQKKFVQSQEIFGQSLNFFCQALIFWYTKKKFWYNKKKFGRPKNAEPDQKFPETEQIFFWSTKKSEKQTGQLVDQETDQNHMDGTFRSTKKNEKQTEQLVDKETDQNHMDGTNVNLVFVYLED